MLRMKIVFFEIQGWEKPIIRRALKGHDLKFFKDDLSEENVKAAENADVISVFIYSQMDKKILAKCKKVKFIATRSTGFDHIDLKECKKRNIEVSNVPFYGENTVAEHTFALILALSRNVHKSYLRTIQNDFSIKGLKGFDLKGKTLGVIGAGHIGLHVIKMAKGFGMNVKAFDPDQNNFIAEVLGYEYCDLNELFKNSDIISLNLPYNENTHHFINEDTIKKMKKGVIIINTARGGIIDTDALLMGLQSGKIGGAGLDVVEGEELIQEEKELLYSKKNAKSMRDIVRNHILFANENVVFTPHIAFYSQEALRRIIETTSENILGFLSKEFKNSVL
ncbi:hydroxyacid dehydrogenase [Candidatus Peregrinibacteria bacterium]|nr:hydroxyacid dehydrogenase [Candidatus Peregrinibacteria bacterium]